MIIIDTHTHDYSEEFDHDRHDMMEDDHMAGVLVKIQIGCDEHTSLQAIHLALEYPFCHAAIGLHPCYVMEQMKPIDQNIIFFEECIQKYPTEVVAIGETGLDFYHEDFPQLRICQEESFQKHAILAQKHNLPMIVHSRNARTETLDFFKRHTHVLPQKAIIHCFSEDASFAQEITSEYGYFLGIGGVITYPKNHEIREAIKKTPIDFLITETDAPYLSPQSKRGKRNQSKNIKEVIQCIAEIKNIPPEQCASIVLENAKRCFENIII